MDLDKTHSNPKLELRRRLLIRRAAAEEVLRSAKRRALKPRAEIFAALDFQRPLESRGVGPLAQAIVSRPRFHRKRAGPWSEDAARLFLAMADRSALLEPGRFETYLPAAERLLDYRNDWIRAPETWRPGSYNVARQFASLARHLLARYDVPAFLDEVWHRGPENRRAWFVHVGRGGNLRTVFGLPIPMTTMMAHHAAASPGGLTLDQALRYGQAKGLGVTERMARAVLGTRLGEAFADTDAEDFWATVLSFLARHPMLDPAQVGPIIDYLHHQKFVPAPAVILDGTFVQPGPPHSGLSMKGRDPESLVRQVTAWHRQLARVPRGQDYVWPASGIAGYDRIEGEPGRQRRFTVAELRGTAELRGEGAAMRHCVATYAWSCKNGHSAIFSVQVLDADGERRLVTAEVHVKTRRIVQVRGRLNAMPTQFDQRILQAWATVAGLTFGQYAFGRFAG